MRLLFSSITLIGALAAPSVAHAEESGFDGFRIEAIGGYDETDAAPGLGAQDGVLYGARVGYDRDLGTVVLGVEGDFAGSDASTQTTTFRSDADNYWTLAARAGVKLGDSVLVFARGGLAHASVDTSLGDFDETGFTVGGGVEAIVTGRVFVRGEYRYSDYGDRLRGQQYVAGVGLRF